MNHIIQGLWIGESLSAMERLSIASFLRHGHEYHLYCYHPIGNVPAGTTLRDANEILPESKIFRQETGSHKGSVAPFADWFRYCLLWERGGWWADTDIVCLRPLSFQEPLVLASERRKFWRRQVNQMLIKAPPRHPLIGECRRRAEESDKRRLAWAEIGPELFTKVVKSLGLQSAVQPPQVFAPLDWWNARQLVLPVPPVLPAAAHVLHLWNEMWRLQGLDKSRVYPASSLYEQLKAENRPWSLERPAANLAAWDSSAVPPAGTSGRLRAVL